MPPEPIWFEHVLLVFDLPPASPPRPSWPSTSVLFRNAARTCVRGFVAVQPAQGSELKEVIWVLLGDPVVIAGTGGGPRLSRSVLLGTDGGHCNNELLQDIQIAQLSKLHRKKNVR